jgi:ferredoxin-NADP reductase
MLRHRQRAGLHGPALLLLIVRTPEDAIYRAELEAMAQADPAFTLVLSYTRQAPAGWAGYQRRPDAPLLAEVLARLPPSPQAYVCGPTGLVETVTNALQTNGLPPAAILTERFGPTGR